MALSWLEPLAQLGQLSLIGIGMGFLAEHAILLPLLCLLGPISGDVVLGGARVPCTVGLVGGARAVARGCGRQCCGRGRGKVVGPSSRETTGAEYMY